MPPQPRPKKERRRRACAAALALAVLALAGCASAEKKKAVDPQVEAGRAEKLMAEKKKYYKARLILQDALGAGVSDKDLNARIQLDLADAYFHDGGIVNLAEALSRYTNFLAFNPLHPRADYAQYQVAMCHFKQVISPDKDQAETLKAIEEFRRVGSLYPASPYVAQAEQRILDCQKLLADHELTVGLFYARRRAYPAAIDRYKMVLDRYPEYTDKPQIYFYMAEALFGLERPDEARAYLKLLLENYPGHAVIPDARELLHRLDRRFPEPLGVAEATEG